MSENKTQFTDANVMEFIDAVPNERKRRDSYAILEMMREITGEEPRMYGPTIVGFGRYHYKYESGREGDSPLVAFSPRKANLTLYVLGDYEGIDEMLGRLGKFKTGKTCLYINKLDDVDQATLREMIRSSVEHTKQIHQ
jgi:hypothetical protein